MKHKLVGIVGAENVIDNPEVLESYTKDESFAKPMMPVMSCTNGLFSRQIKDKNLFALINF